MIRILLLVDCANDFDRNLLRGIVRYSRENGPWLFYRLPSYYRSIENGERSILEWAKAWKAAADRRLETEKRVRQDVEPRPVRPPRVRAAHDHSAVFADLGTSARSARQQEPRPNRKDSFFQFRYSEILNSKTFHPLGTRPKTRRSNQNTNACR